ncbi:MAG: hypothetical protein HC834_04000 [Rhodospirillales bacterium]|nr:hypothetical protein [Rhodospirillales bacterium]
MLLRRFGLILENLDGFDNPGVLRSVPHTLGMSQSIAPDRGDGDTRTPFPLAAMTGWSGDGAPIDGSLKNFALGAVVQHFPRTLNRRECTTSDYSPKRCDFRVPTSAELDALEAFQLFLGRQSEVNIEKDSTNPGEIVFRDPFVEAGKVLFSDAPAADGGRQTCNFCHNNAGANDPAGNGRLFATGTNKHPKAPPCLRPRAAPADGGFGTEPVTIESGRDICGTRGSFDLVFRGNDAFNSPSLIEAADTPPFFHNNIAETIEDAVAFYNSDVFGESPSGRGRPFALDTTQVQQVAAMLRVLNAIDNIDNSNRYDEIATRQAKVRGGLALQVARVAASETEDAIQVLTEGPVRLYEGTPVVQHLHRALRLEERAIAERNPGLLARAVRLKNRARSLMIVTNQ